MLSNALRVGHRPINSGKAREKRVETQASRPAPAPVQPAGEVEQRPIVWKHVALGTAAVGAHLVALSEVASPFTTELLARMFYAKGAEFWSLLDGRSILGMRPEIALVNAGLVLSLLLAGGMFFKKQQRAPMLLNALAWIVLLQFSPYYRWWSIDWRCCVAALASLATAFALGRKSPPELEAPEK